MSRPHAWRRFLVVALSLGCGADRPTDVASGLDASGESGDALVSGDLPETSGREVAPGADGSGTGEVAEGTAGSDVGGGDAGVHPGLPAIQPGPETYKPGGLLLTYFPGQSLDDLAGPLPAGGAFDFLTAVDLTPDTGFRSRYPKGELLIAIDGGIKVETAGVYRIVFMVSGAARLTLSGHAVVDVADVGGVVAFDRSVELSPGWYPLSVRVQRDALHPHLQVFFGREGSVLVPLAGAQLGYSEAPPEWAPSLEATLVLERNGSRWARLAGSSTLPAALELAWTGSTSGGQDHPDLAREHTAVIGLEADGSYEVTGAFTDLWGRVASTEPVTVVTPAIPSYRPGGLLGEYFQGGSYKTFETRVASRLDGPVDMPNGQDGNTSGSFRIDMEADKFGIRWTGGILLPEAGLWTLIFTADDGNRLYLDDELMAENWNDHGMEPVSATMNLPAGWHPIRLEMYEQGGGGGATFEWEGPKTARALVPGENLGAAVSDTPGAPSVDVTANLGANKVATVVVETSELAALTVVLTGDGMSDVVLPASSPTTSYRWSGAVPSGMWTVTATTTDLGGNVGGATAPLTIP